MLPVKRYHFAIRVQGHTPMLHEIEREAFEALKGAQLTVTFGDYRTEMTVRAVDPVGGYTQRPKPPFRLELGAAADCPLRQGMLTLDHPTLGPLEIFVTCVGYDEHGMRYEAVFN